MKRAHYRLQKREHQGVVNRAFGGRCVQWGPWRTVAKCDTQEEAMETGGQLAGRGLWQWRVMLRETSVAAERYVQNAKTAKEELNNMALCFTFSEQANKVLELATRIEKATSVHIGWEEQ